MSEGTPTVVIVGRPNVGKSTLFNRITGQRRSIVGDEPGITRDRIHGFAEHDGRRFELIDTGGIVPDDSEFIPAQILKQAHVALERASHIILLVDGRSELTAPDRDLARILMRLGKPVSLAVNKVDSAKQEGLADDFYSLGIRDIFPLSSEHGIGVDALLDNVTANFAATEPEIETDAIRIAIIGRPNVGKSTLLNTLTGQERAIVSPIAGTTRDAVDEEVTVDGHRYVFIDTAGIRRKSKTKAMAEKLSVVMARRHIRMADVVLLVVDGTAGMLALDATIAGYAHEGGRGVIVCVNKWDEASEKNRRTFEEDLRDQLKFLDYAQVAFISAKTGEGVKSLFEMIRETYAASSLRVTTGELNRFVESLHFEERKIYYITQASIRPPTFVLFTNRTEPLHFSHERNLINRLRKQFGFRGTPVVIKTRGKKPRGKSCGD